MAHLAKFRKGWSNENLAQYILYKFAFTANPSKIADDIGIDFICTLFKTQIEKRTTYLYPKNSFAIQIKSNFNNIDITNKIDLFNNLELPFFIGVVDQDKLKLSLYSGEFIQLFFSHKEINIKLGIKLTGRADNYSINDYYDEVEKNYFLIHFPFLAEISITETKEQLKEKILIIENTTSMIFDNISSKRNHEYIFSINSLNSTQLFMFAGPGSINAFRINVINRITEAFYNLNLLFDMDPALVNFDEYKMYKNFYNDWKNLNLTESLPKFLVDSYNNLEKKFNDYLNKK